MAAFNEHDEILSRFDSTRCTTTLLDGTRCQRNIVIIMYSFAISVTIPIHSTNGIASYVERVYTLQWKIEKTIPAKALKKSAKR
jgi:hypothetical protein